MFARSLLPTVIAAALLGCAKAPPESVDADVAVATPEEASVGTRLVKLSVPHMT